MTIGEAYGPAMKITTVEDAQTYLKFLVADYLKGRPELTHEQAEAIQKQNLGYYAGYYDNETRARVERLFACEHPIFGSIEANGAPTPEEAFRKGQEWAEKRKEG